MEMRKIVGIVIIFLMVVAIVRVSRPIMVFNTIDNKQITIDPLVAWSQPEANMMVKQKSPTLDNLWKIPASQEKKPPKFMSAWVQANEANMVHYSPDNYLHLALLFMLGLGFLVIYTLFFGGSKS